MVINIAHRGSSFYHTENTRSAILAALHHQSDMIEVDIRVTKDHKLILFHDETLQRLAKKLTRISSLSLDQLKKIPLRGNERVLALTEFLDLVNGKMKANIEVKVVGYEKEILKELKSRGMLQQVVISSTHFGVLKKIKKLYPSMRTAYVSSVRHTSIANIAEAGKIGVYSISLSNLRVSKSLIDVIHNEGMKVMPYAINSPSRMWYLIKLGVDGIFTDRPDLLGRVLASFQKKP